MLMAIVPVPDHLIFEFLIRLPVKSLARFKCINKNWCSLISNPGFIYAHLQQGKTANNSGLLLSFISHDNLSSTINFFTMNDHGLAVLEFSVQVCLDSYCVLPSCNGLVCFYGVHGGIHVCNPGTKKIVRIPGSDATSSRLLSCGFGFDQQACTYKVITISEPFRSQSTSVSDDLKIEIFTMGTNSWRTVQYHDRFRFLNRQPPVFAGGFFYWITADGTSGFFIASFNIVSEIFEAIYPPESVARKNWHKLCIGELGEKLCLVDMDFESEGKRRIDNWLLNGVSESCDHKKERWVQETILHPSEPLDATRPVALHGRSEILLQGLINGSDTSMNLYNLQTGGFRRLCIKEIPSSYFHVGAHVESLVPLNM